MTIEKDLITQLSIIHDNLMTISTNGQGSFTMVNCIQELRSIIFSLQEKDKKEEIQKN